MSSARNLPDWEGSFPLGKALKDALGPKIKIDNDVNVATNAEFELGAGRPYKSLLGVFWGTGVGGGIVLRGRPGSAAGRPRSSATCAWRWTAHAARAAGAAAWRPMPGAARWSSGPAIGTRRATRPTCSRSWRSAAATG